MQKIINEFISGLKLGRKQSYKNLTVFALLSNYNADTDYLTLDEALSGDLIDVLEKDEAGKFIEAASGCRVEIHQSVGQEIDCRLGADGSTGFALAHKDQVLHMSLFAKAAENNQETPGSRIIRFSHRRNRRF